MRLEFKVGKGVLDLLLTLLAGVQAPLMMLSQSRQEAQDRLQSEQDRAVNPKAQLEMAELCARREAKWADLLELQRRQLALLERLVGRPSPGEHLPGTAERIRLPRRPPVEQGEAPERLPAG